MNESTSLRRILPKHQWMARPKSQKVDDRIAETEQRLADLERRVKALQKSLK